MERENLPKNDKEGFQRVCDDERYVFFTATAALDYFQPKLPCKVVSVDTQMSFMNTFAFAKGFPYKQIIRTRYVFFFLLMRDKYYLGARYSVRSVANCPF